MEKVNSLAVVVGLAKRRVAVAGAIAAAVALVGTKVLADDASDIEQFYSVGSYVQYDNTSGDYPIITAVGSKPTVVGPKTYTGWSVFAQDATGSLDIFSSASVLTTITANAGATLNVGDKLNLAGGWGPFHQIPEISLTSAVASNDYCTTVSTGNALPSGPVFTVNQLNSVGSLPGTNLNIAGFYLEVDNATITATNGFTSLPGYTTVINNETYTLNDSSGNMTMFDWTTSYSAAAMLTGTPIGASNHYNVEGFVSYNTGGPLEFTVLNLQAVPEPSSIFLAGAGLVGLLAMRRRRS